MKSFDIQYNDIFFVVIYVYFKYVYLSHINQKSALNLNIMSMLGMSFY
jgi:hypothetical protein